MRKTPPPEFLTIEERGNVGKWCWAKHRKLHSQLEELWDDCRDYYLMQGERGEQLNWEACFRRWVRRQSKGYQEPRRGSHERPQEHRKFEKTDLAVVKSILSARKKA